MSPSVAQVLDSKPSDEYDVSMKYMSKVALTTVLSSVLLTTAACGPSYEGAATVVEKDKDSRYVKMGNTRTLRHDYDVKLCPQEAGELNEHESMECFWTDVTRNEYKDINVDDVVTYSNHNIER